MTEMEIIAATQGAMGCFDCELFKGKRGYRSQCLYVEGEITVDDDGRCQRQKRKKDK